MTKNFDNVIIWGYPYGTHTHSYVWYGFYRAFKALGYNTYWANDTWTFEKYSSVSPGNTLVICERNDMNGLPILKDATYLFHMMGNRPDTDMSWRLKGQVDRLVDMRQFCMNYWDDKTYTYSVKRPEVQTIDEGCLFEKSDSGIDSLYVAWATDLLPHEIDHNDMYRERGKECWFIGTVGGGRGGIDDCLPVQDPRYDNRHALRQFRDAASLQGIELKTNCPWLNPLTQEKSTELVKSSYLSPDVRMPCMVDWGYIPCRVMKNISYGQLGLTNSPAVHEFLQGEIICREDGADLFEEGQRNMKNFDMIRRQMNLIKDKHTYINRAQSIIKALTQ